MIIGVILALVIATIIPLSPLFIEWPEPARQHESRTVSERKEETSGLKYKADFLLQERMTFLQEKGVPVPDSFSPNVRLSRAKSFDGRCVKITHTEEYDYTIALSKYIFSNMERSIRNTLYHELLHTVPGASNHGGIWKKWAKFVSEKLGYDIQRTSTNDETPEDLKNLREGRIGASPRTKDEINRLLADCRRDLTDLGVPISKSISPSVHVSRARNCFGWCRSNMKQTAYDYELILTRQTLSRPRSEILEIMEREILRTVVEKQAEITEQ